MPDRRSAIRPVAGGNRPPVPDGGLAPRPRAPRRRAGPDLQGPARHERYHLIEFTWAISGGIQPVILAERELLH